MLGAHIVPGSSLDVRVGDTVRSYDFPRKVTRGVEDGQECYVEGVVEAIVEEDAEGIRFDCPRYKLRCTRRVFGGKERDPEAAFFYPPVNGTASWLGGMTNGVRRLD